MRQSSGLAFADIVFALQLKKIRLSHSEVLMPQVDS